DDHDAHAGRLLGLQRFGARPEGGDQPPGGHGAARDESHEADDDQPFPPFHPSSPEGSAHSIAVCTRLAKRNSNNATLVPDDDGRRNGEMRANRTASGDGWVGKRGSFDRVGDSLLSLGKLPGRNAPWGHLVDPAAAAYT